MAANTPELFEVHYSVPMTGGVVNTINTRLDVRTVAYILNHSDCKVFIVDRQFQPVAAEALLQVERDVIVMILMISRLARRCPSHRRARV